MWPFKQKTVQPILTDQEPAPVAAVRVQPAVFNPSEEEQLAYAKYRADAIARCLEQREAEGMEKHPEHDAMVAEALSYGWKLVPKLWNSEDIANLSRRLGV